MAITSAAAVLAAIAPTLAADPSAQDFLDMSAQQLATGSDTWGAVYYQAVAYHAAHCLTLVKREAQAINSGTYGAPPGAVTAEGARDLSRSYGSAGSRGGGISAEDEEYLTTTYGRRFIALRNSRAATGPYLIDVNG